jgi:hypothetical protein
MSRSAPPRVSKATRVDRLTIVILRQFTLFLNIVDSTVARFKPELADLRHLKDRWSRQRLYFVDSTMEGSLHQSCFRCKRLQSEDALTKEAL